MADEIKTAAPIAPAIDKPALPPAAAPALPSTAAVAGKHDVAIERWFAAAFHGSPHMRDTDAFNHVRRSVDELKRLLATEN